MSRKFVETAVLTAALSVSMAAAALYNIVYVGMPVYVHA